MSTSIISYLDNINKNQNAMRESSTVAGATVSASTVADKSISGDTSSVTQLAGAPTSHTVASAVKSVTPKSDEKENSYWELFDFVPFKCQLFYPGHFKMYIPMNSFSSMFFRVDKVGDPKKEELSLECAKTKETTALKKAQLVAASEIEKLKQQGFIPKQGLFSVSDVTRVFFTITFEGHGFQGINRYMIVHEDDFSYTLKCQSPKHSNSNIYEKFFESFTVKGKKTTLSKSTLDSLA